MEFSTKFMLPDKICILEQPDGWLNPTVKQFSVIIISFINIQVDVEREEWKLDTLSDLLDTLTISSSIIYVNTRKKVDWLAEKMRSINFPVSSLVSLQMELF